MPSTPGETVLEEAQRITSGDRHRDYGHPADEHQRIAALWTAYLDGKACREGRIDFVDIDALDVARMMILLKIARDVHHAKRDNWTDIAGYARCLERIYEGE
jgi:hypothetical protein